MWRVTETLQSKLSDEINDVVMLRESRDNDLNAVASVVNAMRERDPEYYTITKITVEWVHES